MKYNDREEVTYEMEKYLSEGKYPSDVDAYALYDAGFRKASDVIDEFVERLKCTLVVENEENFLFFDYDFTLETIDKIAKYMKGERNE